MAHSDVLREEITEDNIRAAFLKKKLYWSDNIKIRPIDQLLGSEARTYFLKNFLGKGEIEMSEYWIEQKQMNGLVQPIQIESNDLVIQLVKSMPGSIGYILVEDIKNLEFNNLQVMRINNE